MELVVSLIVLFSSNPSLYLSDTVLHSCSSIDNKTHMDLIMATVYVLFGASKQDWSFLGFDSLSIDTTRVMHSIIGATRQGLPDSFLMQLLHLKILKVAKSAKAFLRHT